MNKLLILTTLIILSSCTKVEQGAGQALSNAGSAVKTVGNTVEEKGWHPAPAGTQNTKENEDQRRY